MKSRSSQGVGNKVDLDYNIETMRITDSGGEDSGDGGGSGSSTANNILNKIKTSTVVTDSMANASVPPAEIQSAKLKSMIAGLRKSE
jgi:hypothetical protein